MSNTHPHTCKYIKAFNIHDITTHIPNCITYDIFICSQMCHWSSLRHHLLNVLLITFPSHYIHSRTTLVQIISPLECLPDCTLAKVANSTVCWAQTVEFIFYFFHNLVTTKAVDHWRDTYFTWYQHVIYWLTNLGRSCYKLSEILHRHKQNNHIGPDKHLEMSDSQSY